MLTLEDLKRAKGPANYRRANQIIPGGSQLFSKRSELFAPDIWPAYFSKAKGSMVWDLDENPYLDMSIMGIGACILGYADDDVDAAVIGAIRKGVASTLNCPEELELAETLLNMHPWAEQVRYTRGGGEAISVAIRLARAASQRDLVLFSGYHGWTDWYLAANLGDEANLDGQLMPGLAPNGVPRGLKGSAIPFQCNNVAELKTLVAGRDKEIAAIIIEPARGEDAPKGFLLELKEYAKKIGAVLIFDEITTGFRMCAGGIHLKYGVNPDMAVFAKCIANGYAMAAIIGIKPVMEAAKKTFISSTNWTERVGPTAALATINKYMSKKVDEHVINIGTHVQSIWKDAAKKHDLAVKVSGIPTLCAFAFQGEDAAERHTYFTVEMLKRGMLGFKQFKPSFAHSQSDLEQYQEGCDAVFAQIKALGKITLNDYQKADGGFFRLTKE